MKDTLLDRGVRKDALDQFEVGTDQVLKPAGFKSASNQSSIADSTERKPASTEDAILKYGLTHTAAETNAPRADIFESALAQ